MKALLLALLLVASPAYAEDLNIVFTPQGNDIFWDPRFPLFTLADATDPRSTFAPSPTTPFDLGSRDVQWSTVYAEGYWSNGQRGMDGNVTIVHGCALVVRGGLIIGTTGLSCPR